MVVGEVQVAVSAVGAWEQVVVHFGSVHEYLVLTHQGYRDADSAEAN